MYHIFLFTPIYQQYNMYSIHVCYKKKKRSNYHAWKNRALYFCTLKIKIKGEICHLLASNWCFSSDTLISPPDKAGSKKCFSSFLSLMNRWRKLVLTIIFLFRVDYRFTIISYNDIVYYLIFKDGWGHRLSLIPV